MGFASQTARAKGGRRPSQLYEIYDVSFQLPDDARSAHTARTIPLMSRGREIDTIIYTKTKRETTKQCNVYIII